MGMPWLGCHNPEIDWKIGEVKIMRCPDECGKKWKVGKQMKPGWKKQEEKEEKKEMRRPIIEEEKTIERIMEEKEKAEKDLIQGGGRVSALVFVFPGICFNLKS